MTWALGALRIRRTSPRLTSDVDSRFWVRVSWEVRGVRGRATTSAVENDRRRGLGA
jgi:hypothetical protein